MPSVNELKTQIIEYSAKANSLNFQQVAQLLNRLVIILDMYVDTRQRREILGITQSCAAMETAQWSYILGVCMQRLQRFSLLNVEAMQEQEAKKSYLAIGINMLSSLIITPGTNPNLELEQLLIQAQECIATLNTALCAEYLPELTQAPPKRSANAANPNIAIESVRKIFTAFGVMYSQDMLREYAIDLEWRITSVDFIDGEPINKAALQNPATPSDDTTWNDLSLADIDVVLENIFYLPQQQLQYKNADEFDNTFNRVFEALFRSNPNQYVDELDDLVFADKLRQWLQSKLNKPAEEKLALKYYVAEFFFWSNTVDSQQILTAANVLDIKLIFARASYFSRASSALLEYLVSMPVDWRSNYLTLSSLAIALARRIISNFLQVNELQLLALANTDLVAWLLLINNFGKAADLMDPNVNAAFNALFTEKKYTEQQAYLLNNFMGQLLINDSKQNKYYSWRQDFIWTVLKGSKPLLQYEREQCLALLQQKLNIDRQILQDVKDADLKLLCLLAAAAEDDFLFNSISVDKLLDVFAASASIFHRIASSNTANIFAFVVDRLFAEACASEADMDCINARLQSLPPIMKNAFLQRCIAAKIYNKAMLEILLLDNLDQPGEMEKILQAMPEKDLDLKAYVHDKQQQIAVDCLDGLLHEMQYSLGNNGGENGSKLGSEVGTVLSPITELRTKLSPKYGRAGAGLSFDSFQQQLANLNLPQGSPLRLFVVKTLLAMDPQSDWLKIYQRSQALLKLLHLDNYEHITSLYTTNLNIVLHQNLPEGKGFTPLRNACSRNNPLNQNITTLRSRYARLGWWQRKQVKDNKAFIVAQYYSNETAAQCAAFLTNNWSDIAKERAINQLLLQNWGPNVPTVIARMRETWILSADQPVEQRFNAIRRDLTEEKRTWRFSFARVTRQGRTKAVYAAIQKAKTPQQLAVAAMKIKMR